MPRRGGIDRETVGLNQRSLKPDLARSRSIVGREIYRFLGLFYAPVGGRNPLQEQHCRGIRPLFASARSTYNGAGHYGLNRELELLLKTKSRFSWETVVFALICAIDLISTVILVRNGRASEGNPLLGYYMDNGGLLCFIAAKTLLVFGPLFVLEYFRQKRPQFIRMLLRSSIVAYLVLYTVGSLVANFS